MSKRLQSFLAVMISTLCGVLVMTALSRLYVVPLVFNDTSGFMRAALWSPDMIAYRTPLYGWLLIAAKHTGLTMLPVWFQIFFWLLCVAAFATLVLKLSGSVIRTVVFGMLFVLIETAIMYSPGAQWLLLSDPLYATWTTLGLLLMLIGTLSPRNGVLWTGAGFVGTACLMRPVLAPLVPAVVILLHARPIRTALRSQRFVGGTAILLFPLVLLSATNKIAAGSFGLSPISGLNMGYYTRELLTPQDKVFEDPALDEAFHRVVYTSQLDPKHNGFDPFYLTGYKWWPQVFQFLGSRSPTTHPPTKRFELSAMSAGIAGRLILRHPAQYMQLVFPKLLRTMVPLRESRTVYFMRKNPFEFQNTLGYSWHSKRGNQWKMGSGYADPYSADLRIGTWIDAERYGVRLPMKPGPKTLVLLVAFTALALTESVRRLLSPSTRMRVLGLSILTCIAHTYLNALAVALVTLHDDPRYGLPGIMTGTAAFALSLLSLSLRAYPGFRGQSPGKG